MVGPQEARFLRAFHKRSFLGRHFNGTPYWGYLRTKTHVAYLWLKPCHVVELWNPSSLGELFGSARGRLPSRPRIREATL